MDIAPEYRVVIVDIYGQYKIMNEFTSLNFSYSLNRAGNATLVIPVTSEDNTEPTGAQKVNQATTTPFQTWIRIYRWSDPDDESTKRLVWTGMLFDLTYDATDTDAKVTLNYRDYAGILEARLVDSDFSITTPTDASDILWQIINATQQKTVTIDAVVYNVGDLGITQGTLTPSKDRQLEKDLQNRTILNVLTALSEYQVGIDWEITPTPRNQAEGIFNTFFRGADEQYHKGNLIPTPLVYYVDADNPQYINNIQKIAIEELGSSYANQVRELGATTEDAQLISTASNDEQQHTNKLFQTVQQETSVSVQDTLDDKAEEDLKASQVIPRNIKLSLEKMQQPVFGTFDVGDIFTLQYKYYEFRNFTNQYRLYKFTVSVDDVGVETLDLELNNL